MMASATTCARVEPVTHNAPSHSTSQLLLRGTRDGDLAATLLSSQSQSSSSLSTASSPKSKCDRTPLFTWLDLVRIVSTGNLERLSRHPDDLREYFAWMDSVKSSYGSVTAFLLRERFTATELLKKAACASHVEQCKEPCFRSYLRPGVDCQILVNDWPYSVPRHVTHHVVWSHVPILHRKLVIEQQCNQDVAALAWSIISKRGLCGTITGSLLTVPTVKDHASHLPDLVTISSDLQDALQQTLHRASHHLVQFIHLHWDTRRCDIAFFANPPSLQSVPSLAHFHVLVKSV